MRMSLVFSVVAVCFVCSCGALADVEPEVFVIHADKNPLKFDSIQEAIHAAMLGSAFADSIFAQAAPADDDRLLTLSQPATGARTPYQEIYLDDGSVIVNRGPWTPENRKEGRPDDLWRTYMHGVVDHFATPVPLGSLLSDEQKIGRAHV